MSFRLAWKPYMYNMSLPHLLGGVKAPALVVWGDDAQIRQRFEEHHSAGADHVAVQLLTENDADLVPGYASLASALGLQAEPG